MKERKDRSARLEHAKDIAKAVYRKLFLQEWRRTKLSNILMIQRSDAKRIFSSVICLVMLFGLCVVPCLYAWFNIFSNWDPYGVSATSRIKVAVVSQDEGMDIFGEHMDIGAKVIDGLKANDQIGWQFMDTEEEAMDSVYSGKCYAALIIPENFSADLLSFLTLDFEHPQLLYYENDKKNAIAPKITGKAKTAVQETINATVIETLSDYVGQAIGLFSQSGITGEDVISNLNDSIEDSQEKLEVLDAAIGALVSTLNTAQSMTYYSAQLLNHTAENLGSVRDSSDAVIGDVQDGTSSTVGDVTDKLARLQEIIDALIAALQGSVTPSDDPAADPTSAPEASPSPAADDTASPETSDDGASDNGVSDASPETTAPSDTAEALTVLAASVEDLTALVDSYSADLTALSDQASDTAGGSPFAAAQDASDVSVFAEDADGAIGQAAEDAEQAALELFADLQTIIQQLRNILQDPTAYSDEMFNNAIGPMQTMASRLTTLSTSLGTTAQSLDTVRSSVQTINDDLERVQEVLLALSGSDYLNGIMDTLSGSYENLGSFFFSPISMDTEVLYSIDNYGSAMAPFYTVLAQWVGALFCIALLKSRVRVREIPSALSLTMPERFFGRFGVFLACALIQAIVVAAGDLWYVGIDCANPFLFFFACLTTGICFIIINYSLVFALENIGLGASVIIMVIQVAGSGGSYPIEVVPEIFQKLYPFMPFNYAMNSMREAIGGTYGGYFWKYQLAMLIFSVIFLLLGQLLYNPAHYLNHLIYMSKKDTEVMIP